MSKTFSYAYIRGKTCKIEKAVIPIQAKVVQYGLGCFTGIRGYWNPQKKNLYLFRLEDHFKRLKESAKIIGMKFDYTYPKFKKIIIDLIKKNKIKEDMYIRITLYAASTKLTPRFDNKDDDLAIYMIPLKDYFNTNKGLNVCVSSWRRFDDNAMSTKAKITGSYANSALAKSEALRNGYDEAILLNSNGSVCEATGANIFGVKNGILITPPLSAGNLNGITRRSIIKLAKSELNLEVREEEFDRSTLYTFDELFLTGTAAKISWISSVGKKTIGNGKIGKFTKKFQKMFESITLAELEKYQNWCTSAY